VSSLLLKIEDYGAKLGSRKERVKELKAEVKKLQDQIQEKDRRL
jgi:peptidoglycan hydrolase CwlO-like protein